MLARAAAAEGIHAVMPDPKEYDILNPETWSTEALIEYASWLYEAADYDDLAKIAAILDDRTPEAIT